MKLQDYLTDKGYTTAEFAALIQTDRSVVHRWLTGKVYPRAQMAQLIVKLTKNAVTFEDLYGA